MTDTSPTEPDAKTARRDRIRQLATHARYSAGIGAAAAGLSDELGVVISAADAVSRERTHSALDAAARHQQAHLLWHREWGAYLRGEYLATARRLGALLGQEHAILVYGQNPRVGFRIPAGGALVVLAPRVGTTDYPADRFAGQREFLMVAPDGESGVRFGYGHLPSADEYWIDAWGSFARSTEPG